VFNALDSALFRMLNDYARSPILDSVLPFFSLSWPLWLGVLLFFSFFTLYCRKHYGDALWRLLALVIVLGLSVTVSELGAYLMKDGFERPRPYQVLSGTIYHDVQNDTWVQIQKSQSAMQDNDLADTDVLATSLQENLVMPDIAIVDDIIVDDIILDDAMPTDVIINDFNLDADISVGTDREMPIVSEKLYTQGSQDSYQIIEINQTQLQAMLVEEGFSMPSAFAANVMAMALVIALLFHKASPWIYMLPILVGWSRVYTGNSYPMDILVGWIWGILAVAVAWLICDLSFKVVSKKRKL